MSAPEGLFLLHQINLAVFISVLTVLKCRLQLSNIWLQMTSHMVILVLWFYLAYYFKFTNLLSVGIVFILLLFVFQNESIQINRMVQMNRILIITAGVIALEQVTTLCLARGVPNSITGVPRQFFYLIITLDFIKFMSLYLAFRFSKLKTSKRLTIQVPLRLQFLLALLLVIGASLAFQPIRYGIFIVGFLPTDSIYFYQLIILVIALMLSVLYGLKWLKRRNILRAQNAALEQYNHNVEKLYNQLSLFRHDYLNILYSLRLSIEQDDMKGIRQVFEDTVAPTQKIIQSDNFEIGKLSRIESMELKSILYTKLVDAQSKGIRLGVDIGTLKWPLPISSTLLIRMIAILLDNAIQAAESSEERCLSIALSYLNGNFQFSVSNSYKTLGNLLKQPNAPSHHLASHLVPSKNGHGLYYIKQAVSENPSLQLLTDITPTEVNQHLRIRDM